MARESAFLATIANMIPMGNLSSGEQGGRRWEKEGRDGGTVPKK